MGLSSLNANAVPSTVAVWMYRKYRMSLAISPSMVTRKACARGFKVLSGRKET